MKAKEKQGELLALKSLLAGEVAERKALEEVLRVRMTRFDEFFRAAPVGLAVLDNQLRYVGVNEALARMNGLSAAEHRGKAIAEVLPSIAPLVEDTLKNILRTGDPVLNLEVRGELAGVAGGGRWLLSFVPLGDEGSRGIGAVVLDISESDRLSESLAPSGACVSALFEHSWDAIFFFDEEGRILDANPRAQRLLDYTRDELHGLRVQDLIPASDLEQSPFRYEEIRAGRVVRSRRRLRRRDGRLVSVEAIGSMVGEGVVLSFVRESEDGSTARIAAEANSIGGIGLLGAGGQVSRLDVLREMAAALAAAVTLLEQSSDAERSGAVDVERGIEFYDEVSRFETSLIRRALSRTQGNQKRAAELLGLRANTLAAMIQRYGIDPNEYKS